MVVKFQIINLAAASESLCCPNIDGSDVGQRTILIGQLGGPCFDAGQHRDLRWPNHIDTHFPNRNGTALKIHKNLRTCQISCMFTQFDGHIPHPWETSGPRFNMKTIFRIVLGSHYRNKMVPPPSHFIMRIRIMLRRHFYTETEPSPPSESPWSRGSPVYNLRLSEKNHNRNRTFDACMCMELLTDSPKRYDSGQSFRAIREWLFAK